METFHALSFVSVITNYHPPIYFVLKDPRASTQSLEFPDRDLLFSLFHFVLNLHKKVEIGEEKKERKNK